MQRTIRYTFTCLLLALVVGCAAPIPRLNTASGKPEVLINKGTKKQIIDYFIAERLSKGLRIKSVTEYELVVNEKITDPTIKTFYGSSYNPIPELRTRFNFVQSGSGVIVYVTSSELLTNPDSHLEKSLDITAEQGAKNQASLENLKARIER